MKKSLNFQKKKISISLINLNDIILGLGLDQYFRALRIMTRGIK